MHTLKTRLYICRGLFSWWPFFSLLYNVFCAIIITIINHNDGDDDDGDDDHDVDNDHDHDHEW